MPPSKIQKKRGDVFWFPRGVETERQCERVHLYLKKPDGCSSSGKSGVRRSPGLSAPRDAVAYVLDQFPIVRRKDEERFGEYRTKRLVLETWEKMASGE
jgi:hypothetical protein